MRELRIANNDVIFRFNDWVGCGFNSRSTHQYHMEDKKMSEAFAQQASKGKSKTAEANAASMSFFEKNGDHRDYQSMLDSWRIRNGLAPLYFKETTND